jgi:hypothetical protein
MDDVDGGAVPLFTADSGAVPVWILQMVQLFISVSSGVVPVCVL